MSKKSDKVYIDLFHYGYNFVQTFCLYNDKTI